MRYKFIFGSTLLLLLTACQPKLWTDTPEGKAHQKAYALCNSAENKCYKQAYPSFYQTEVQKDSADRSARQRAWQAIGNSGPDYTTCNTYGSTTSCSTY